MFTLEGGRFNRSIGESDIKAIQTATSHDEVTSTWGKIKDWFCGTHVEEAKVAFYQLIHVESDDERLRGFHKLCSLVSSSYKSEFVCEDLGSNSVRITIGNRDAGDLLVDITLHLTPECEIVRFVTTGDKRDDLTAETSLAQLRKDITRSNFCFDDGAISNSYTPGDGVSADIKEGMLQDFASGCNEYQQRMLGMLASQIATLDLFAYAHTLDSRFVNVGYKDERQTNVFMTPAGDILVKLSYAKDFPSDAPGDDTWQTMKEEMNAYSKTSFSAIFLIGKNNTTCDEFKMHGE